MKIVHIGCMATVVAAAVATALPSCQQLMAQFGQTASKLTHDVSSESMECTPSEALHTITSLSLQAQAMYHQCPEQRRRLLELVQLVQSLGMILYD